MDRFGGWAFSQDQEYATGWTRCPECQRPLNMKAVKPNEQTPPDAEAALRTGDVGPEDIGGSYTVSAKCGDCGSVVQAGGVWFNDVEYDTDENGYDTQSWAKRYNPRWLSHYPKLTVVPAKAPQEVQRALRRADTLFWTDTAACATALRHAVEVYLDSEGISRTAQRAKGKTYFKGAEERIADYVEALEQKGHKDAEQYEEYLRATKFIGDDATHGVEFLTDKDIAFGAKFITRILELRYVGEPLLDEARRITAKRPASRRKKAATPPAPAAAAPTPAKVK